MKKAFKILMEQLQNFSLIIRMIRYGDQSMYQNHYLGLAWKILNPILQMMVYFVLFGLGLRGSHELGTTHTGYFAVWLFGGMALFFYMQEGISKGSNSIRSQVGLVSKMKFPLSTLPTISILSNIWTLIVLWLLAIGAAAYFHFQLHFNIVGLLYVLIAMHLFVYGVALLLSTIVVLVPDVSALISFIMRVTLFMSGVIINLNGLHNAIGVILRLNPIYYLIESFRAFYMKNVSLMDIIWQPTTIIFWSVTLIVWLWGAHLHEKFKQNFVEYI
ncbi:MAG TPA: ABC transporter permease [Lactobacillaceae bacterium]|jgi:teichoic acid transport system permease protein